MVALARRLEESLAGEAQSSNQFAIRSVLKESKEMPQPESKDVLSELKAYRDRIQAIMALIRGKQSLTVAEKTQAQELLKALKADLKADDARCNDARLDLMSEESRFLRPAVQDMKTRITVATNSHPLQSNWYPQLDEGRMDVEHALAGLERERARSR